MIMLCMCAGLQGCHVFGGGPMMPDLGGVYVAHDAYAEADEKIADEISASFKQAEEALRRGDLEGVLAFYAKGYTHKGFNAVTIGSTWKDLLQKNRELSITLVFERISIEAGSSPPKAQVICTGSLWGVSRVTGRRHHIESWFDEVYHLVYENGRWRTQGRAWEVLMEKETRSARPPHPFS
jgi:hypothetical protein